MSLADTYLKHILNARVYDVARETPLEPAAGLSRRLNNRVWLKREDLQPIFSFKIRGAYNKIANLSEAERAPGVITSSAGNHAQGVALSAQRLGIKATIVMPRTTPPIKVAAVRALGGRAVLHGDAYDEAYAHACKLVADRGLVFVPPYDDPDVIAGQGTVGLEILRQHTERLDAVFVPVGGGGLVAGVAAYIKALRPEIQVIGVEPDDAPSLHHALRAGKPVDLGQVGLFADGVAVRQVGAEPFRVARECVDRVVLVSTDEICAAIKDIFEDTRSLAEPAGALALAGLKRYVAETGVTDRHLVAIDSGANTNFDRLRHVAERAELGEQRETLLAVTIPEQPGSFRRFCQSLGKRLVTEFNYRYEDDREARVFVGVQLNGGEAEKVEIIDHLRNQGYGVVDMSDNEMAKLHVRYMVGGRAAKAGEERLFRFEFPERPGALLQFLSRLGQRWNISLFHYRNHGAAYGRVLMAVQASDKDDARLERFFAQLDYPWQEETGNPAYDLFLN